MGHKMRSTRRLKLFDGLLTMIAGHYRAGPASRLHRRLTPGRPAADIRRRPRAQPRMIEGIILPLSA